MRSHPHPYQSVHEVSHPDRGLVAKPRGPPGGDAIVHEQDRPVSDAPGLQKLWLRLGKAGMSPMVHLVCFVGKGRDKRDSRRPENRFPKIIDAKPAWPSDVYLGVFVLRGIIFGLFRR